jgi:cytochrome c biogenesis protein
VLRPLAHLKLAIAELAAIAALSAVGTVIEQNKPLEFYAQNYPDEGPRVLGFLTYGLIDALQLDRIYSAPYFLALMALLAASLAACTTTTQWPMVRVAQRWRFRAAPGAFDRLEVARRLPAARLADLGAQLAARQYQVFVRDGAMYAFKGLSGKLGPIGVHASMLAVMAGVAVGALGGFSGPAMIPEGSTALVAPLLRPASPVARLPAGGAAVLRVDAFRIDTRPDGSVRQFFTDVAVTDLDGNELQAKTVSVNQPLRFGGVTAYQTDWSLAAVTVRARGAAAAGPEGAAVNLAMASLEGQPGVAGRLWAAFLPIAGADPSDPGKPPPGISLLARDPGTVTLYDAAGKFAGVRRPGSGKPLTVDGVEVEVVAVVAASGLELKHDPGVPLVYAGFGGARGARREGGIGGEELAGRGGGGRGCRVCYALSGTENRAWLRRPLALSVRSLAGVWRAGMCITTVISYLSHSQVWAAQVGGDVLVGGRSNRAKFGFERELAAAIDGVPEVGAGPPPPR